VQEPTAEAISSIQFFQSNPDRLAVLG